MVIRLKSDNASFEMGVPRLLLGIPIFALLIKMCPSFIILVEVNVMKNNHYYIYLTERERFQVIQSLIKLRNALIEQGKYTDAVDDIFYNISTARKKSVKIKYV